jgi:flagella basal body P-ring formation protein FlgA
VDHRNIVLLYLSLAVGWPAAAAEVRLRSSARCSAPIVRLADIAEINSATAELAEALGQVPLCPGPAMGSERTMTQHDVRQLLTLSGVEPGSIQITGSESVTLLTETTMLLPSAARRFAHSGAVRQAVFEAEAPAGRRQPQASPEAGPPSPPSAASGPQHRLVERGGNVAVHAHAAGIRVTTAGKALEAGAAGDTITVELADTHQRVLARVVGQQIVEVAVGKATGAVAASSSATHP